MSEHTHDHEHTPDWRRMAIGHFNTAHHLIGEEGAPIDEVIAHAALSAAASLLYVASDEAVEEGNRIANMPLELHIEEALEMLRQQGLVGGEQ